MAVNGGAMAQPDGLEALDGLAAQVNNDLQSLKDFNLASNHLFEEKAYFYYRYLTTIMNIVQFINEDLGPPGQGVVDVFFQEKYGLALSTFYDYRKLATHPELQGRVTSTMIRSYQAGEPAPQPPPPPAFQAEMDRLHEEAINLNDGGRSMLRRPLSLAPVTKKGQTLVPEIKRQMKAALWEEGLGKVELQAIKHHSKAKTKAYEDFAASFPYTPEIIVYHGTSRASMEQIAKEGFDVNKAASKVNGRPVMFMTSNPAVADAWSRDEVDQGDGTSLRHMVVCKALLVGGLEVAATGCTGNSWRYHESAMVAVLPLYTCTYEWRAKGTKSNQRKPTFPQSPPGLTNKPDLERGNGDKLAIYRWFLKDAVFARGFATPQYLQKFFGG